MAIEVRVPEMGESIVEAVIGNWLKREGDAVSAGEALVELETEKVNIEVAAEQSGVLERILKREGETVSVGEVIAVIAEGVAAEAPAARTEAEPARPVAEPQPVAAEVSAAPAERAAPAEAPGVRATPAVRRLAEEYGVDLRQVPASGEGGRITREDVLRYVAQQREAVAAPAGGPNGTTTAPPAAQPEPAAPPSPPPVAPATAPAAPAMVPAMAVDGRREERVRMTQRRKTIAQRLVEAQRTAAMLTTFNEIDMSAVIELRRRWRDRFRERYGVSLGFMSFFTKAVVGALKAFPMLNAEIQGDEIVLKYYYDIGIAVGAEEGLVVPVVRDADRKSFAQIEREIEELARKARERRLTIEDLSGGTFTITNGGVFGSLLSTPILNPPQVGILGMHKIEERPVVVDGQIVVRPMMYVALTYDHRIVDGREAVQFLVRVKELIEDPEQLLLEA
ncbi:2-oxoglutarate dehydrogenase complex dihydrolipoyllysine-residue succinyltransferase [Thermomicrobiaceae bacterium CFH 74404]|uniref:Dihydrolipoyllysine-residue succinyltransferase component of 2-oxoglutarate dehydrogenase complex n=1 Tax=Thermalbibacter longus TaxID=2951981 RepID=A0AA42B980_9BACT|nr:2-oxoglutarate dehydrogenase complex dihydrolipoyllysine-residue succinyltransferase [Thermalbibacter longus]MCM8747797.1 2-oxoglutarate dehydrogenase complex dihydrolipoyllysine-residue succinyltransferase [Thermalbibacter longus]